jgi:hypothetical protein
LRVLVKAALLLTASLLCAAFTCDPRTEQDDYENFVEAVANAEEVGYTPYWLGRDFSYNGVTFFGPSMPDFGAEIQGGVDYSYYAELDNGGGRLQVVVLSESGWQQSGLSQPVRDPVVKSMSARVLDEEGTVTFISGGAREVNVARFDLKVGDTYIVV